MNATKLLVLLMLAAGCSKNTEAHAPAKPADKTPAPIATPAPKPTPPAPTPHETVPTPIPAPQPSTPPAPTPTPTSDPNLALTVAIREALERQVSLNDIQVTANEGDVTLTGTVATAEEKDAAVAAARGVPGVRTVDNQLTIKGS
jgi:outer membrane biosynthesis protein TonB